MDSTKTRGSGKTVSPNLYLLGSLYGLIWGCAALGILTIIGKGELPMTWEVPIYLITAVGTGITMTLFFAPRLGWARGWKLWIGAVLALLVGTQVYAFYMAAAFAGVHLANDFKQNIGLMQSIQSIRAHDSLIMFYWYPLYGFGLVFPIFLAAWNCRDLSNRMSHAVSA